MTDRRAVCLIVFLAAASSLAGCSHHNDKPKSARLFYSPNGEPLNGGPLGQPTCPQAMASWFDRVNVHHDGKLTREEFLADAQAQYQRMDIDHNGYLVSEELERFRKPYRADMPIDAEKQAKDSSDRSPRGERAERKGGGRFGPDTDPRDHGGTPTAMPDPVLSADTNNDFKVTLEEFMAQAQSTFNDLDADRDGVLSKDEALRVCKPKE